MTSRELRKRVSTLFDTQRLAVLATVGEQHPHASLVAFAATRDLHTIVFATARTTRKFANLAAMPRAALLVDSRTNGDEDFHAAMAVTAYGPVSEVPEAQSESLLELFIGKHLHLRDFVGAPTCALMQLDVQTYSIVDRFQHVLELNMTS